MICCVVCVGWGLGIGDEERMMVREDEERTMVGRRNDG